MLLLVRYILGGGGGSEEELVNIVLRYRVFAWRNWMGCVSGGRVRGDTRT